MIVFSILINTLLFVFTSMVFIVIILSFGILVFHALKHIKEVFHDHYR